MAECPFFNQRFESLITTIESLKKRLDKDEKSIQVSENLNLEGAVKLLNLNGYPTSKSSIYKLTSTNSIPFKRFGSRLLFVKGELLDWADSKLSKKKNDEVIIISKAASKNLYKKKI
jgi:hypothetical protein